MWKLKSRIISAVIALAMILQLVPAVFVPAQAEEIVGQAQKISFGSAGTNPFLEYVGGMGMATLEDHGWQVSSDPAETTASVYAAMATDNFYAGNTNFSLPNGQYITILFNVNETGYYNIDIRQVYHETYSLLANVEIDGKAVGALTLVDEEIDLGSMTLTQGTHKLKIISTSNRRAYLQYLNLTPVEDLSGYTVDIKADGLIQVDRLETVSMELGASLNGNALDMNNASSVTAKPSDESIVSCEIVKENGKYYLKTTGLKVGDTNVIVNIIISGEKGRISIPVTVFVPSEGNNDLKIDFLTNVPSTPDAANLAVHGWAINYDESTPYAVDRDPNVDNVQWRMNSGLCSDLAHNHRLAVDFMVRKAGYYSPSFIGNQCGNFGSTVAVYVDDKYAGEFCFSHPSDVADDRVYSSNVKSPLNSIYLSAGEHTVTIRRTNTGSYRHSYVYWCGVEFKKLDISELTFARLNVQANKTTLCNGEKTGFTAQAIMSDGSARNMGPLISGNEDSQNSLSVSTNKSWVASVSGNVLSGGSLTGTATITVTGKVDGVTKQETVSVTVDSQKLSSITAKFDGEMYLGGSGNIGVSALSTGGREIDTMGMTFTYTSSNSNVVTVDSNGFVTAKGVGNAQITVTGKLSSTTKSTVIPVSVKNDGLSKIEVSAIPLHIKPDSDGTQLIVKGISYQGREVDLSGAQITYSNQDNSIINVSSSGKVTPTGKSGKSNVTATVKTSDFQGSGSVEITVSTGKTRRSYYTDEMIANARENAGIYSWAKSEVSWRVNGADKQLPYLDFIYNNITTQELPRSVNVGYRWDPEMTICRYCGYDMRTNGGSGYNWTMDPINSPWKLECPSCRRKFPSNDFWSFYELGIVTREEYGSYKDIDGKSIPVGQWSYKKSHIKHGEMFGYNYEEYVAQGKRLPGVGYLKNNLYPEIANVSTINAGRGLTGTETVDSWGVDDGYGYKTGTVHTTANGKVEEAHTYISAYNRRWINEFIKESVVANSYNAYLFTGEEKYGRMAAIILDRLADVYPEMKLAPHFTSPYTNNSAYFNNSDSTSPYGKVEGCIWETGAVSYWILGYDAVWPMYEDEEVISYLSDKAAQLGLDNDKTTTVKIRDNLENRLIRGIYQGIVDGDIYGNFGMHQTPTAQAAVVLDTPGETREMLDYLMTKDESGWHKGDHTGGDVLHRLYNGVDRDGGTGEGLAPNYTTLWYNSIGNIAGVLNGYDGYAAADLYQIPKVQKMMENQIKLIMARRGSLNTGDSGSAAGLDRYLPSLHILLQCFEATGNVIVGQSLYFANGNTVVGLKDSIFKKNPEKIQERLSALIAEHGEYPFDESIMHAGQGFASLRGGTQLKSGNTLVKDSQHGFWMSFSPRGNHGHPDALNLGIHAYGLDFAPELGYPTAADGGDEYKNWGHTTINHNTVIIDNSKQASLSTPGTPLHFEDADLVKVMDISAPQAYYNAKEYRRTLVSVKFNNDISYGVDFFRVKGGTDHLYSFHSQSDDVTVSVPLVTQNGGTYAGVDIPWKTYGISTGYSYLYNVRKAMNPGVKEFTADFNVTDFRNTLANSGNMGLNLKMFNDFEMSEISLVDGDNPYGKNNPKKFTYLFARRVASSGSEMDSTFTTLLQPYKGSPYIQNSTRITNITRADGKSIDTNGDVVRAIKVELTNGNVDYIVYATNNQAEYIIDNKFRFSGFVGVMRYNGDKVTYSYLSDGTKFTEIANSANGVSSDCASYSATVINFTRSTMENGQFIFNNEIVIRPYEEINLDNIKNRWIYVENDGISNGAYRIENARFCTDEDIARHSGAKSGDVLLEIGNVSLIRSAENVTATGGDYKYNIVPNQYATIPLSVVNDASKIPVTAVSIDKANLRMKEGETVTLTAKVVPNNAHNKGITWKSSDETVVTVDNGVVTAVGGGTAIITASSVADATKFSTCTVTVTDEEIDKTKPYIEIGKVTAFAGETVEVPVTICNNPGILGMEFDVAYPQGFTITGIERGDALADMEFTRSSSLAKNPIKLFWDSMDEVHGDGLLAKITFTVPENAEPGEYRISASPETIYNDYDELDFGFIAGGITIVDKNQPTVEVAKVEAAPGESVKIPITLSNNPGILGMELHMSYSDKLTITGIERGDALADMEFTRSTSLTRKPIKLFWDSLDTVYGDGVLAYITVTVAEDAQPGESLEVYLTVETIYDDYDELNFNMVDGGVDVIEGFTKGDINGDGKLNTRDVATLRRYLAGGYEDTITFIPSLIDVNGDGRENTRDVAALRLIIAG